MIEIGEPGSDFLSIQRMKSLSFCAVAAAVFGMMVPCHAEEIRQVRSFYFGNSLTGCTNPLWHGELGKSVGKEWIAEAKLGAGWQLWMHREELKKQGVVFPAGDQGDLTIDPELIEKPDAGVKNFFNQKWDACVLQPFEQALRSKRTMISGKKLDKPTEVGDLASAKDIIDAYLRLNPKGTVYLYMHWPKMEQGTIPPENQRPEWARKPGVRIAKAEFPMRESFEYEREWLEKKYVNTPEKPRIQETRCRDYHYQLFEALKARYPALWREGRLRAIPTGDVFLALHKKMKSGQFPGCENVADYYTDVQHIRAGLPRYTAAACFYACLFREKPDKLDWRLYNDNSKYGSDLSHDKGELFEITPERARIVNETIWEVMAGHPYTKIKDD